MHPNPIFRRAERDQNLGFARERGFGILSINGQDGPLLAHVPFLLNASGDSLDLHLVRSNPIARALDAPTQAVIAVSGPDSYVSPDWYGVDDQVPTWNYVAVHLRGTLELLPQEDMREMLDRQSAHFEEALQPKTPWTASKMTPDALDRMMRQIVPARMQVSSIDGTWKLNQNKPDEVRLRAAQSVKSSALGSDTALLSALMLAPRQD
ncbi:FMN-binding negative transcriptional regulator [Flavimaricola marinus]|uniref:Protease synthase and sporulation protein PAI 2 n=1 Tax=Flavimaricola marinus TaxID=1819565 RepID=A0A238LB91_9RHOB|nr:FMN-binding negative transcriptional regulator [Flavimaricola marinus]SMY06997.1 Protease synthase and sporulation protein PAI 2 [Flavimaricola marinus]